MMRLITLFFLLLITAFCENAYVPKPKAYPRIELPEPQYIETKGGNWHCPFTFEYSIQSAITVDPRHENKTCWYNIYYPAFRATLHLTYFNLNNDLANHIEESRKLAMKHIAKASQIEESLVSQPTRNLSGMVYDFEGETASDLQFFLTDSTTHFLRGALYFNVAPNKDSLAPVIEYIKTDISHLINSFEWKQDISNIN